MLVAAWALLTVAELGYVLTLGTNAPQPSEWEAVPALTGHDGVLPWVWEPHDGTHRPLPRAVCLVLFRLTHDFRAGMVLQVLVLSGLALGLIRLADNLRGGPHWADVFFPAALLHTGHWANLLMGSQLGLVLSAALVVLLGTVALMMTRANAFRTGSTAGGLLVALALCGGPGLAVVPPVALRLLYVAAVVRRTDTRWHAAIVAGLAVLAAGLLAVLTVSVVQPLPNAAPGEDRPSVATLVGQALATAVGIGFSGLWPALLAATLALGAATVAVLARSVRDLEGRPAASGVVAVVAGVVALAVVAGVTHPRLGEDPALWSRYSLPTWPLLGLAYLVWVKRGGRGGKWVPAQLCLVAALAFPPNTVVGLSFGAKIRTHQSELVADAARGRPPEEIAAAHLRGTDHEEAAARGIPMLRGAKVGGFGGTEEAVPGWVAVLIAAAVAAGFAGRWVWHLGRAVQVERARELFRLQHERFEQMLRIAAADTGKPRGLTWVGCEITGAAVLARDRQTRGIVAFVPVVIRFEPVAGGDMEDVPAAREPRPATAVFAFVRGHWTTDGRVVFNHTPEQTLVTFGGQFVELGHHH